MMRATINILLSILLAAAVGYLIAHTYNPSRQDVFMDGFDRFFYVFCASMLITFAISLGLLFRFNR